MFTILIIAELLTLTLKGSPDWYTIGCFVDDYYRDLEDGPVAYGYNADTCLAACSSFLYFALQDGGQCACGNSYSTAKKYYEVDVSQCGEDGLGRKSRNMIYGKVEAVHMDPKYWWCSGSCSNKFGTAYVAAGASYMQTSATFARPLNLSFEIKNIDKISSCGLLSLFPKYMTRHSGYNMGVDWWGNQFGFGVDKNVKGYAYVTNHDWHKITIEATETKVLAYYQGVLQATLEDTTYMRGKIRIGYNCRNFAYKNFILNGGVDRHSATPTVSPTSSPSIAPTTSEQPTIFPTLSPSVSPTKSTEDSITVLGVDMTHGMAKFVEVFLVLIVICLCIPVCIFCFSAGKKVLDERYSGCELAAVQDYNVEVTQENSDMQHTQNEKDGEI
jgi:hypothetical protein